MILSVLAQAMTQLDPAGRSTPKRLAIVQEALTWMGTPYHPHARVRGAGVDCAMLLGEVYEAQDLLPKDWDPGFYPPDWHLHRSEERYLNRVKLYGAPVSGDPLPGDIALFKFGRTVSHGVIVVAWPLVVHAYRGLGVILSRETDAELTGRFHSAWTLFGDAALERGA